MEKYLNRGKIIFSARRIDTLFKLPGQCHWIRRRSGIECSVMGLIINPRVSNDTVVLDMKGRLWVLDLPLRDRIQALLAQGCRFFVLNLAEVDYIDSSGLGQLIAIWTSVRTKGGNLVLLRAAPRIRRLLVTTRLQVIFDVFDDEEKAKLVARREWPQAAG